MNKQKWPVILEIVRGKTVGFGLLTSCVTVSSALALDFNQMQTAQGLANIVSSAPTCGFEISEQALEAYYAKSGLDSPEGLAYINNMISVNKMSDKADKSECVLARTTAKSIGVLQN